MPIAIPDPLTVAWIFGERPLYAKVPINEKTNDPCVDALHFDATVDLSSLAIKQLQEKLAPSAAPPAATGEVA